MTWLASPWVWLLVAVGFVALLWWLGGDDLLPPTRPKAKTPAICAWCRWRDGEDCTNPGSPVSGQSCGPVCAGRVACKVREVRPGGLGRLGEP